MDNLFFYITIGGATLILIVGAFRIRRRFPRLKRVAPNPASRNFARERRREPSEYLYRCQDCGDHFHSQTRIEHIFLCPPCLNIVAGF